MQYYSVGQAIPKFVNHEEGVLFDISEDGSSMIVFFDNPTEHESAQFSDGNPFEMRFISIYNIIMITSKIGSLNWMDAPYSPHLSQNLAALTLPKDNHGLSLVLYLVNSRNGKIISMRLLGLSTRFTKEFFNCVSEEKKKEFDLAEYKTNLYKIYRSYSTKELVKMSSDYCKIN